MSKGNVSELCIEERKPTNPLILFRMAQIQQPSLRTFYIESFGEKENIQFIFHKCAHIVVFFLNS